MYTFSKVLRAIPITTLKCFSEIFKCLTSGKENYTIVSNRHESSNVRSVKFYFDYDIGK